MDDWITAGIGAWLGNRWFGPWFKRHAVAAWVISIGGMIAAVMVLIVLH
jgi:hypothetical protein